MDRRKVPEEQIIYANILYYGGLAGIIFMAVTFAVYVSGVLPTYVPLSELPELWMHETITTSKRQGCLLDGDGWSSFRMAMC